MSGSQTVTGSGNTNQPGIVTIAAGITAFYDDCTVNNTVEGSGQTGIAVRLGKGGGYLTTYISNGGSGSVTAYSGNEFVQLSGTSWYFVGSTSGGESVNTAASNSTIMTYGGSVSTTAPSNSVSLDGANSYVLSRGTHDLIESYFGNDTVNVTGTANVLVAGGAVTVHAEAGSYSVVAFFDTVSGGSVNGGKMYFLNNSTVPATVSGNVPGGHGGSVTAYGAAGGGVYVGGSGGNNSLIGGTGAVTLVGAGSNSILDAAGFSSSYAHQNVLEAGSGGAVMYASTATGFNEFYGGTGTDTITTNGKGAQTFYFGAAGAEYVSGSTVSGATNEYILDQDTTGNGQDIITNFRLGTDHIDINLNGTLSGVTIAGITTLGGGHSGSIVYLSDKTTIQLYGVSKSSLSTSLIGGTHI